MFSKLAGWSGSASMQKNAGLLELLAEKAQYIVDLFRPFTKNEFFFSTNTMQRYALEDSALDTKQIAWRQYFFNYVYGLNKFILHEDLIPVTDQEIVHTDLKLTTDRLFQWDDDHHMISFPGKLGLYV